MFRNKMQNTRASCMRTCEESARENPLQSHPLVTAHPVMQWLIWMGSIVSFAAIDSYPAFGLTSMAHVLILGALLTNLIVFHTPPKAEVVVKRVKLTK